MTHMVNQSSLLGLLANALCTKQEGKEVGKLTLTEFGARSLQMTGNYSVTQ